MRSFPSSVFGTIVAGQSHQRRAQSAAARISRVHDMPGILKYDNARIIAVCDLDSKRVEDGKKFINGIYAKKTGKPYDGVTGYSDFRELLNNKDIDAVVISTPDHWHAIIGIHAVEAGKDVYLQKPASLTISEGRALSDAVHHSGRIFQIGSQQRSTVQFRYAAELVRNGRIGKLQSVEIGLPGDPSGPVEPEMPVPKNLNYNMWLGSTPEVYYTEKRVHPQANYDRPGWLRCEQFGAGMITGWGSHHVDSAHWAMDTEYTGPVEVWGSAQFPKSGLWDVHGDFKTEALYANGVKMTISGAFSKRHKVLWIGRLVVCFTRRRTRQRPAILQRPSAVKNLPPAIQRFLLRSLVRKRFIFTRARISTATGWTASLPANSQSLPWRSAIAPAPPA